MTRKKALAEAKKITKQLVEKYHPLKVILFGSAARTSGPNPNDLDFLVIKDNVPYDGLERMREVHRLMNYDVATDFLVMKPAEFERGITLRDPFILQSVLGEGMVLYGS